MRALFFLFFLFLSVLAHAASIKFPQEFLIKHPQGIPVSHFFLETPDSDRLGFIRREANKPLILYTLVNRDLEEVVTSKAVLFATEATLEILAPDQSLIGMVQRITRTLLPVKYQIYDAANNLKAVAEMNWVGTRFTFLDPQNAHRELVTFCRPYFRLLGMGDYWYVKIHDAFAIDSRILAMIAVFQSDLDVKYRDIKDG